MQPSIPKIRPGDVLLGTKHLRNWLRTAGTFQYLQCIREGGAAASKARGYLYTPAKTDTFLVTTNTSATFGVYGENKDLLLLFPVSPEVGTAKDRGFMNPVAFSQWFIRTGERRVDTTKWPLYAYYMWISLHLNMNNAHTDRRPPFFSGKMPAGPFDSHRGSEKGKWTRESLQKFATSWIARGVTRESFAYGGYPAGPRVEEIQSMREAIQELCRHSATVQRLKMEEGVDFTAFRRNYL